ncbi:MAG: NHLP family bacteriocin export ABC transporter peptidase/permease/ATPase subunit [Atopobiaceae bacterium]|nr:NHLP family bacteriocin export ABC transporter peptidase/permease/ATPase subunit [Atopobiaceae bacterium]
MGKVAKVPQIMQMEALECGAACLCMILAYYGRWVPLEQMRVECGVSRDGSKAVNILKTARNYGLEAKGMTFSTNALRKSDVFPCIVFWNFVHFVVVDGFKGNYVYLNDPAKGQVKISLKEFDEAFTGVVLTFKKTDAFEEGGKKPDMFGFVRKRLEGLAPAVVFAMLTAGITALVSVISLSLNTAFVDRVLTNRDYDWLNVIVSVLLLLTFVTAVTAGISAINQNRIRGKIAIVSSSRFMRHLLHLPIGFYSQRMVGDLQQRQNSNESIAMSLISELAPVLVNGLMLVMYLAAMIRYSPLLAFVGVTGVVINAFLAHYISERRINIARSAATESGKLYATTVGGVEMIETIKASGAENGYFGRWAGYQAAVSEADVRILTLNEYLGAVPMLVSSVVNVLVLTLGVWLIVNGRLSEGALLTFNQLLSSFLSPVTQLIGLGQTIQEMRTQAERVEDVMRYECDVPEELEDAEDDDEEVSEFGRQKLRGQIDLEGVSFGYSPLEPPLIEDFDLHIKPGQWVAFVGPSGCGKSTIAKIVAGLYPTWSGSVRFDGVPIEEVPRAVLRGSLAVVDQDIVTFEDSVSENVKLWDRSIEDYEVILACRDASIHSDISQREGGYQCKILPGGSNFSGGQLQRIEIARVLAQDPSIIILDEATSALDAQTEADVIRRIRDRGATCIVVAHRLSTIRDCDEIIVLKHGKVDERGTHEELIAKDGTYATLIRSN